MKAKLVGLLQSHGPRATTVRHVLLGSCRVVPVPRDLVQIIAAAVGESLARRTAARRPFPLRAAGEPVAIGFWIDAGNDISCFENFALGEVDRLETLHFALGVAPFQSIEPADALHGVVWQGVCGGFFEVVSLGLRKGAHGLPFAPGGFRFAQGKRFDHRAFERRSVRQNSALHGDHFSRLAAGVNTKSKTYEKKQGWP